MCDQLELFITERTENHARIVLAPCATSGIAHVAGVIRGPFSDFSKTLTADSPITPGMDGTFEALLVEPCYWTPSLPFWYDLRLAVSFENGLTREEIIPVGIKRFYCERRNFLIEGKRVVLRGMKIDAPTDEDFKSARRFETVLIIKHAIKNSYTTATRLGVPLVIDLRIGEPELGTALEWYSAVLLALVNAEQIESIKLGNVPFAVCVDTTSFQPNFPCHAYAIELQPGERPPAWAATCDKPVIVIRKAPEADIRTARAACDKLQAELAPEFDLAGYFV